MAEPAIKNDPIESWLNDLESKSNEVVERINPTKPVVTTEALIETPKDPPAEPAPQEPTEPVAPIEEPPTQEAEPAEPEDTQEVTGVAVEGDKKPSRPRWSDVKEAQRQAKESARQADDLNRRRAELEMENASLRGYLQANQQNQPPPPAPEQPDIPEDPLTVAEKQINRLAQEQQMLRAQMAARDLETNLANQENVFERHRPDYPEALRYLVDSEVREAEARGSLHTLTADLYQRLGPQGFQNAVAEVSRRTGLPMPDAAKEMAKSVYLNLRRNQIVRDAMIAGRNVPEVTYENAVLRGWKGPEAKPAQTPKPDAAAIKEAAQSLSSLPRSPAPANVKQIRTRGELAQFLGSLSLAQRDKWIDAQDAADPSWDKKLAD